jgi:hypothetical protein
MYQHVDRQPPERTEEENVNTPKAIAGLFHASNPAAATRGAALHTAHRP